MSMSAPSRGRFFNLPKVRKRLATGARRRYERASKIEGLKVMVMALKAFTALIGIAVLSVISARLIFALPPVEARVDSTALTAPADAPLSTAALRQSRDHPDKTGV